jgi:hypothetical protein
MGDVYLLGGQFSELEWLQLRMGSNNAISEMLQRSSFSPA